MSDRAPLLAALLLGLALTACGGGLGDPTGGPPVDLQEEAQPLVEPLPIESVVVEARAPRAVLLLDRRNSKDVMIVTPELPEETTGSADVAEAPLSQSPFVAERNAEGQWWIRHSDYSTIERGTRLHVTVVRNQGGLGFVHELGALHQGSTGSMVSALDGRRDIGVFVTRRLTHSLADFVSSARLGTWTDGEGLWRLVVEDGSGVADGTFWNVVALSKFRPGVSHVFGVGTRVPLDVGVGNPDAVIQATHVYGVYTSIHPNPSAFYTQYDDDTGRWYIHNVDGSSLDGKQFAVFEHRQ